MVCSLFSRQIISLSIIITITIYVAN